jgi:hypothetical protein
VADAGFELAIATPDAPHGRLAREFGRNLHRHPAGAFADRTNLGFCSHNYFPERQKSKAQTPNSKFQTTKNQIETDIIALYLIIRF